MHSQNGYKMSKTRTKLSKKVGTHGKRKLENGVKSHNKKWSEVGHCVNLPLIRLALPGALMPAAPSVAMVAMGWIGGWEQSSQ